MSSSCYTIDTAVDMLKTGRFGDFKIICEGFEFNVYENILYQASPCFAALIDGPFVEGREHQCIHQETSCMALAYLILGNYIDRYSVEYAYMVWPALQNMNHFSLEYPNEDATWALNSAYESSIQATSSDWVLGTQTFIRLNGLADRLLLPEMSKRVANCAEGRMLEPFRHTVRFADNARFLLDIYRYIKPGHSLRNWCKPYCLGHREK